MSVFLNLQLLTLHEKCPHSVLFWSVFSHIRTAYGEIFRISPYSVQIRENTDQNNSEYGHFLCNASVIPANIHLFEVDSGNTREGRGVCSNLTKKARITFLSTSLT